MSEEAKGNEPHVTVKVDGIDRLIAELKRTRKAIEKQAKK